MYCAVVYIFLIEKNRTDYVKVNDFLRIGIQLRHQTSVQVKDLSQRIYYKEILLDKESREVNVNGVAVHLTGREFDLLKLF